MIGDCLGLVGLQERHYGLTPALAEVLAEAATVCLDRHHRSPESFRIIQERGKTDARADWAAPDERTKGAWANKDDATEVGACCLALAALELTT